MKIRELPELTAEARDYAERVAQHVRNSRVVKPATTSQCPSTERLLSRDPKFDKAWQSRSLPDGWQADRFASWQGSAEQIVSFEAVRRRSKNTQGDAVSEAESSVSPERRQLAIEAFQYSGGTRLTPEEKQRIVKMNPIPVPPIAGLGRGST